MLWQAAALLLVGVWPTTGEGAAAAGVALRLEKDAAGGRGRMVSGREAGAGEGVAEETMAPKF